MTKADLTYLNATDQDINQMPVDYVYFAQKSHLYNRAYGVLTGEQRGLTGPTEEQFQSFVVNDCLRREVIAGLLRVTDEAEKRLGYKLGTKYLVTSPKEWRGTAKVILYPGLEAVEVEQNIYEIEGATPQTIEYWAQEALTLFLDGSDVIARADAAIFENPKFVYLRNQSDSNKLIPVDTTHALYATLDSGDWLLPLTRNETNVDVTDTVNAYHIRHIDVSVVKPDVSALTEGGRIVPVYLDSDQIIAHRVVSEDETTIVYRFDVWVLVHPAFVDETADWQRFETYKMYDSFELRYLVEEPAYLTFIWTEGNDQYTYQYDPDAEDADDLARLKAVIADHERGIVHLYMNDKLLQDLTPYWYRVCGNKRQKMPESMDVLIPIKVSVDYLPEHYQVQVDRVREAVLAKMAAELPVEDCGCQNKVGYIFTQQQPYGNFYANPFTGVEVTKTDFGQRHGQQVYRQTLNDVQIYRKPVRVGR